MNTLDIVLEHKQNTQATSIDSDVFIERIPVEIYEQMIETFSKAYHFQNGIENGGRMRIANYYVGISRSLADTYVQFIREIQQGLADNKYPAFPTPEGFQPHVENLLQTELENSCSFASYDMAVTENGLQNIEFQALATYPISAAKLSQYLIKQLNLENAFTFADSPTTTWKDFTDLYKTIIAGEEKDGIVMTDRLLSQQKTKFEFYATQKELDVPIDLVDMENIIEKDGALFYSKQSKLTKIKRFYNRILLSEALYEDDYPHNTKTWNFRFDNRYESLKFVNHPIKLYEISKRLSPYVQHDFNPDSFELSAVAQAFRDGHLKYDDYVWKHKWGAAGFDLILSPTAEILDSISEKLANYIVQKKVNFKVFKTDDGQEKIIELRFMIAQHQGENIVVPMARLGHITQSKAGRQQFKIHFGDNNKEGYGFSPVVIFD